MIYVLNVILRNVEKERRSFSLVLYKVDRLLQLVYDMNLAARCARVH